MIWFRVAALLGVFLAVQASSLNEVSKREVQSSLMDRSRRSVSAEIMEPLYRISRATLAAADRRAANIARKAARKEAAKARKAARFSRLRNKNPSSPAAGLSDLKQDIKQEVKS